MLVVGHDTIELVPEATAERVRLRAAGADDAIVTYAEIRAWACWMHTFTARDLADCMAISYEVAQRGMRALLYHGIFEEAGFLDGPSGPELIVSHVPLPPGPREHFTYAPEWVTCDKEILSPRGLPIRIAKMDRRDRSTPGVRHKFVMKQKRYDELQAAKARRAEIQKAKATEEPKWRKRKKGGAVVTVV